MGTFSAYAKGKWLDASGGNTTYTTATPYLQLHTGDPGASGTSNVASENTRQAISFSAASASAMTSDAAVTWTGVSATETVTWVSVWDASSNGNFVGSDQITSTSLTAGDNLTFAAGDIDLAIT